MWVGFGVCIPLPLFEVSEVSVHGYHMFLIYWKTVSVFEYGCMLYKEGNVLFNDALNTFYLQLYGIRHMVKDHSDSERGNPLPPHGSLSFRLAARVLLYALSHRWDSTYHSLCCTGWSILYKYTNLLHCRIWLQNYSDSVLFQITNSRLKK